MFLHNHDQIGNRALGERLTRLADPHALRAATALLLLAPHIPLMFMGDEFGSTQPFLYFTSHTDPALAAAVREGRRQELAKFPAFADAGQHARIPDPNDANTFLASVPQWPTRQAIADDDNADVTSPASWLRWTKTLLAIRHAHIVPRLAGAVAIGAAAIGPQAVTARWRMGDGTTFALALNLSNVAVAVSRSKPLCPAGAELLFETTGAMAYLSAGTLRPHAFIAWLELAREPAP
jgi:maltooligosyltrehalose trehalohydrolase